MCGIAGLASFSGPATSGVVARMTAAIAHRGPDGEGFERVPGAEFGHRRLAIRDLSDGGRQPLFDETGDILVTFNGEIYNDAELRAEITRACGYRFRSSCDTEVLPVGWRLWGESLFERLEGMYAIAIWDRRQDALVLARDPVGIKPLFYLEHGTEIAFASEVKAILASGLAPARLDPSGLHQYLASGYVDPERSLIEDIRQVPPGSFLHAQRGRTRIVRHWLPRRSGRIVDAAEAVERVGAALECSCASQLLSDVPLGLLLSSGIDSAILALLLKGRSVPAFTARFPDASYDEGEGARLLAEAGGHPWHTVEARQSDRLEEDFRAVAWAVDGELADSSALAHHAVCRAVRAEVKVALAGDGADEFFGGYETYAATRLAAAVGSFAPARATLLAARLAARAAARREERLPLAAIASRFLSGLAARGAAHPEWRRLAPPWILPDLYGPDMREAAASDPLARYRTAYDEAQGSAVDRALLADQTYYLPGDMLAKVDRISMAHGLEVRVPFLDRNVMELAGDLHVSLLAPRRGPTKKALRMLAESLGAPADITRKRKRGFNVPVASLLRGELAPLGDRLLDRDADVLAPLLRADGLRRLWREHRERRADHGYAMWACLVQATWREAQSSRG